MKKKHLIIWGLLLLGFTSIQAQPGRPYSKPRVKTTQPTLPPPPMRPPVARPPVTSQALPVLNYDVGQNAPWGGGEDYFNYVTNYTKLVRNKGELLSALANARSGDVVYVADNAEIDLSKESDILIREGVTLASGRGKNGSLGALLYCTNLDANSYNLFLIKASNVRITGLRLRGPDHHEEVPYGGGKGYPGCIKVRNPKDFDSANRGSDSDIAKMNVLIDNNDMWAWPDFCVRSDFVEGVTVAYNHLHHNLRDFNGHGAGYGVAVYGGHVLIEKNIFDHNRHDVACDGHPLSSYTFRNNLVLHGGTHHSIDVHGWRETKGDRKDPDGHCIAGKKFVIENNTILQDFTWYKSFWAYNALIRGVPEEGLWLKNNIFSQHKSVAIGQCPDGGTDVTNRVYNFVDGGFDEQSSRIHVDGSNKFKVDYPNALFVAYGGKDFWTFRKFEKTPIRQMVAGDFNGDGKDDLFYADGSSWYLSDKGKGDFQKINSSSIATSQLRFGDFDGDGKMDVFSTNGSQWKYSQGGKSQWVNLQTSSQPLGSLRFGDFDGDGKTDVFTTSNKEWKYSQGGTSSWIVFGKSDSKLSDLLFGDFNGDRKTDVLWVHDGKWQVSWGAKTNWEVVNRANTSINNIRVGDFDGDGTDDLFKVEGNSGILGTRSWHVSYRCKSVWQHINTSDTDINDLLFGDFNGDKRTDVMESYHSWR